jgi:hypothetical protein
VPPAEALGRLLRALGAPADRISPDLLEAAGLYRSMTAERRILLVLDNAVDAARVGWLLPAGAGCAVLVSSRCRLNTLDGADQLHLGPLQMGAAVALLRALAGAERVDRDPRRVRGGGPPVRAAPSPRHGAVRWPGHGHGGQSRR